MQPDAPVKGFSGCIAPAPAYTIFALCRREDGRNL